MMAMRLRDLSDILRRRCVAWGCFFVLCHGHKAPAKRNAWTLQDIEQIDDILNGPSEGWSGLWGMAGKRGAGSSL